MEKHSLKLFFRTTNKQTNKHTNKQTSGVLRRKEKKRKDHQS
jgi:hypothetical protein